MSVMTEAGHVNVTERSNDHLERLAEATTLEESHNAVRNGGRGRTVLVCCEAGVAKTELLQRFCHQVSGSARVVWGACDPLSTPRPLGPLLAAAEVGGELAEALHVHGRVRAATVSNTLVACTRT